MLRAVRSLACRWSEMQHMPLSLYAVPVVSMGRLPCASRGTGVVLEPRLVQILQLDGLMKAARAALQPGHAVQSSLLHASL